MHDQPSDLDESALRQALSAWDIHPSSLRFTSVGFGDYHWIADEESAKWFLKVADLDAKPALGTDRRLTFRALRHAMDTAVTLHGTPDLDFVAAPVRSATGESLHPLRARYALSVFPFLDGTPGRFDDTLTSHDRDHLLDLLSLLHQTPPPISTPHTMLELRHRDVVEQALADVGTPWRTGPFSEQAREAIAANSNTLWTRLAEFDHRLGETRRRAATGVVTHGKPHPGNLIHVGDRCLLIDWETVGLAAPERDLWGVLRTEQEIERYTRSTNIELDVSALAFYRLRWELTEVGEYTEWFRAPHTATEGLRHGWDRFVATLHRLTARTSVGE